jgi:hypothetical protein
LSQFVHWCAVLTSPQPTLRFCRQRTFPSSVLSLLNDTSCAQDQASNLLQRQARSLREPAQGSHRLQGGCMPAGVLPSYHHRCHGRDRHSCCCHSHEHNSPASWQTHSCCTTPPSRPTHCAPHTPPHITPPRPQEHRPAASGVGYAGMLCCGREGAAWPAQHSTACLLCHAQPAVELLVVLALVLAVHNHLLRGWR